MASDKYREFRNFMFNELGITKEDIRQWTREAAYEAAERAARSVDVNSIVASSIEATVKGILEPRYGRPSKQVLDEIRLAIAASLASKFSISLAVDKEAAE